MDFVRPEVRTLRARLDIPGGSVGSQVSDETTIACRPVTGAAGKAPSTKARRMPDASSRNVAKV